MKIILNNKISKSLYTQLRLKIDNETKIIPLNKEIEWDLQNGKHTFQIYQNFIMKSQKKQINITEEIFEMDVKLNYTAFGISFGIALLAILLIAFEIDYTTSLGLIKILWMILVIIFLGGIKVVMLSIFLLMVIIFVIITGLGALKLEVKKN
ncbi:hypothetical protein EII29_03210 [Leptotrichia sp. OH3620_COT-345]|uniref:hypothetical protein n=1 Tax=Leptotrichia sp. OH3620_COT-345 TaxID=2491048 RepID=UPI000F653230|nr:hypothetical protein [Leptotrichia sp. OH3620_COT-345]RRD40498.1 hypothetical protein EII29_03210 [Leptotrichia sp. OH3620_COT-345]